MNRVGRFADKCLRIKLGSQPDVDEKLSVAVWSKLLLTRDRGRKSRDKITVSQAKDVKQNKREQKDSEKTDERMVKIM